MVPFYNQEVEEVLKNFNVSATEGLSSEEVRKRLEEYGENQLAAGKRKTFLKMFIAQFKSFMIIILLIAAVISGITGVLHHEGLIDTYVILGILIINAVVGASQESRAESSLEAL